MARDGLQRLEEMLSRFMNGICNMAAFLGHTGCDCVSDQTTVWKKQCIMYDHSRVEFISLHESVPDCLARPRPFSLNPRRARIALRIQKACCSRCAAGDSHAPLLNILSAWRTLRSLRHSLELGLCIFPFPWKLSQGQGKGGLEEFFGRSHLLQLGV